MAHFGEKLVTWQFCEIVTLFGMVMVIRDPFERFHRDLQRLGMEFGHGWNHLGGIVLFVFL